MHEKIGAMLSVLTEVVENGNKSKKNEQNDLTNG